MIRQTKEIIYLTVHTFLMYRLLLRSRDFGPLFSRLAALNSDTLLLLLVLYYHYYYYLLPTTTTSTLLPLLLPNSYPPGKRTWHAAARLAYGDVILGISASPYPEYIDAYVREKVTEISAEWRIASSRLMGEPHHLWYLLKNILGTDVELQDKFIGSFKDPFLIPGSWIVRLMSQDIRPGHGLMPMHRWIWPPSRLY